MKMNWLQKLAPLAVLTLVLVLNGCAKDTAGVAEKAQPTVKAETQAATTVYTGSIVGMSNKAQTVSIEVGKGADAQTHMLKFDDQTTGIEHAKSGEAAIITWEQRGDDKFALDIKPKLAKLPEGITEIKADELYQLISENKPLTLVDARPETRYNQAHLPGAINIPVPMLKEKKATVLPVDKNELLVFYCGGYT
ncbi:rhodanese-like domain-containing protein [Desulfofustis limnaeus]|jgi:hypothetical protein|nr:rhodanese-like domain-containing protein [Desulfofustis limnaeus]MDX9894208.1 rhodanese-like domain-containing protein [Desulfofustis sp.]